jgi:hypothetical protein
MKFNNLFFLFFICILWSSCNIINPTEPIPTYIHIDSFKFVDNEQARTGSASHAISTVWVTYNGTIVGVYDLPATIPIIATGSGFLTLGPGVSINGMNNFESVYPFYNYDTSTFVANPGKTINYLPTTSYYGALADTFCFMENFEDANSFVSDTTMGQVYMVRTASADSVFEGHFSGAIRLNSVNDSAQIRIPDSVALPGGAAFCEFNYKGTANLAFGMYAFFEADSIFNASGIQYYYGFNPSPDGWQKIYISMADLAAQYPGAFYYVYFKATVVSGESNGYILMDNVKIVRAR